jgi:hypothetical protein
MYIYQLLIIIMKRFGNLFFALEYSVNKLMKLVRDFKQPINL